MTPCQLAEDVETMKFLELGVATVRAYIGRPGERGVNTPGDLAYLKNKYNLE
jgi:hypothetical protein